ncbi:hypothetical protein BJP43_10365 (plasmid) [Candidatus Williamhamiltonella defendens]|uniref:Uncharacterized protein n=1 Tax=Candidatus Williamhamiltonella defendens TaxID=138072 RepID=A0A2D3TG52_9ENTR|nr:hypothetical protein BJP43_10365 [Candidatus Hamiltonella defensa]
MRGDDQEVCQLSAPYPGKALKISYIKTNLLSEKEVIKLWKRYQSIRSGQVKPFFPAVETFTCESSVVK